jgi:hypothetical protein
LVRGMVGPGARAYHFLLLVAQDLLLLHYLQHPLLMLQNLLQTYRLLQLPDLGQLLLTLLQHVLLPLVEPLLQLVVQLLATQ